MRDFLPLSQGDVYILVLTGDKNMHVDVILLIINGNVKFACSSQAFCKHGDLFLSLIFIDISEMIHYKPKALYND